PKVATEYPRSRPDGASSATSTTPSVSSASSRASAAVMVAGRHSMFSMALKSTINGSNAGRSVGAARRMVVIWDVRKSGGAVTGGRPRSDSWFFGLRLFRNRSELFQSIGGVPREVVLNGTDVDAGLHQLRDVREIALPAGEQLHEDER